MEKTTGAGTILSKELYSEAKNRLEALDKKDAERRKTAELKNNLESYIYSMKEKVYFFYAFFVDTLLRWFGFQIFCYIMYFCHRTPDNG